MVFALLQLAYGSQCAVGPQQVVVHSEGLHTRGSLSVRVVGGSPSVPVQAIADRFRLRGPEGALVPVQADALLGEVRFTPRTALVPGSYVLEHRADFDEDGQHLDLESRVTVARSGWFAHERLEVGELDGTPSPLVAPTNVEWTRAHNAGNSSAGFASVLSAKAKAPPGTLIEVEIERLGTVARVVTNPEGKVHARVGQSMCTPYEAVLPLGDDLRVRLVSVGVDGSRAPGAWTLLGPSGLTDYSSTPPPPKPPTGTYASLGSLHTWEPLDPKPPPGDTEPPATACGTLVKAEPTPLQLDANEVVQVDADQRFRRVRIDAGEVWLDGEPLGWTLPSRGEAQVYVAGAGVRLTLGLLDRTNDWLYALRVQNAEVVAQAEVFGVGSVTGFDLDGDELHVAWREPTRVRWTQRFDAKLVPIAPPLEITEPFQIDRAAGPDAGIAVNGHLVDVLAGYHQQEQAVIHEGRAYIRAYAKQGNRVAVVRPDGSVAWSVHVADPWGIRRVEVDADGVHLLLRNYRTVPEIDRTQTFDHDGNARIPALPMPPEVRAPASSPPETLERITLDGRTLVRTGLGTPAISAEEDGRRGPAISIPRGAVVAVRPTGAEIVWTERSDELRTWRQSLTCSGASLGVPDRWEPSAR